MARPSRRQASRARSAGAGGIARLALGFLCGVVFTLVPLFFYVGRGPGAPSSPSAAAAGENTAWSIPATAIGFVSRITYALSEVPEDLSPLDVAAPPTQSMPAGPGPGGRVANPKPIVATPLAPRDTTRGIEDELQRGEYRQPSDTQPATQARFVEGRNLVVGGARSGPATDHLDIESRLAATREWLFATANTTHTIEVAAATNDDQLRDHLRVLSAVLDPQRIFLFRSTVRGRQTTKVIYGAYIDRAAAVEALTALPATVAMHRPTIRTVKGIKAEITRKAAS